MRLDSSKKQIKIALPQKQLNKTPFLTKHDVTQSCSIIPEQLIFVNHKIL